MKLRECFESAVKDEKKGKKHKGILIVKLDGKKAEEYIEKAKVNLELCEVYKQKGFDYKISEEWFYTLYYCALAILSKFGVESRSQRCTAGFLRYVKSKGLIDYDNEFIDRITVYKEKEGISDVDKRESARYDSSIKSKEIERERLLGLAIVFKLEILPKYVFRNSKPAIFGVKVLGGKLKSRVPVINEQGEEISRIKLLSMKNK